MTVKELCDKLTDEYNGDLKVIIKNYDDPEGSPINYIKEVGTGYDWGEDGSNELVVVIWGS